MVVVMKKDASESQVTRVLTRIEFLGSKAHVSRGKIRTIIGVVGENKGIDPSSFESLEGVERVVPLLGPFKLASRDFKKEDSVFSIDGSQIGSKKVILMAGPCAVESREQLIQAALAVKKAGAVALRGGAFKPRTSPYSFQGLGEEGLKIPCRSKGYSRSRDCHRSGLPGAGSTGSSICRRASGGRQKHAKLCPAKRCGSFSQAGPAQKGPQQHHRRIPECSRIRPEP